jgi:TPR repeat protein
LAAEKYIRSLRLGSRRSAAFLLKLIKENNFMQKLKSSVEKGQPDAKYVWAGLIALGFDYSLTNQQALELLESAADEKHKYSIIELGLCYYNGNLVEKDRSRAISYWQQAFDLGSEEGRIRIILDRVKRASVNTDLKDEIKVLKKSAEKGSVLAETALAYCYENGIGLPVDKAEAVKYYRRAAQRGNEAAYNSLLKMYDSIRPNDDMYIIVD